MHMCTCLVTCECLRKAQQQSKDYHLSLLPLLNKHMGISSERKHESKHLEPNH